LYNVSDGEEFFPVPKSAVTMREYSMRNILCPTTLALIHGQHGIQYSLAGRRWGMKNTKSNWMQQALIRNLGKSAVKMIHNNGMISIF
jgi:hypothetical protein